LHSPSSTPRPSSLSSTLQLKDEQTKGTDLFSSITDQNGAVGAQFVGAGNGPNATLNQYIGPVIFSALGVAGYINLNPSVGTGP
jgi:hypothetical protein